MPFLSEKSLEEFAEKCASTGFDAGYEAAISLLETLAKEVSLESSELLSGVAEQLSRQRGAVRKKFFQALQYEAFFTSLGKEKGK